MSTSITEQLDSVKQMLTPERMSTLSSADRIQVMDLMEALEKSVRRERAQEDFLSFCSSVLIIPHKHPISYSARLISPTVLQKGSMTHLVTRPTVCPFCNKVKHAFQNFENLEQ